MEMAHAYQTLAHDGELRQRHAGLDRRPARSASLRSTDDEGNPVETSKGICGDNEIATDQVIHAGVAAVARSIALRSVVDYGTGTNANYGGYAWGKTGTTDNNGDAWFCGATLEITACVWVGHPDSNESMAYRVRRLARRRRHLPGRDLARGRRSPTRRSRTEEGIENPEGDAEESTDTYVPPADTSVGAGGARRGSSSRRGGGAGRGSSRAAPEPDRGAVAGGGDLPSRARESRRRPAAASPPGSAASRPPAEQRPA